MQGIPYKKCGKLIVATDDTELDRLFDLYDRAVKNNAKDVRLVDRHEIKEIEPHCEVFHDYVFEPVYRGR